MLCLVAAGLGVPLPEDIPLVTSGYMCNPNHSPIAMVDTDHDGIPDAVTPESRKRVPHIYLMMIAGMVGVLSGDTIVYYVGRKGINSDNFAARHLRKVMTPRRLAWTEKHFARHGNLTVFFGRFLPGLRSVVFGVAGMARMGYVRFLIIDGLAALISVPTFIWIGFYFADRIETVRIWIDKVKHIVFPTVVLLGVMALLLYLVRRKTRSTPIPATPTEEEIRAIAASQRKSARMAPEAGKP